MAPYRREAIATQVGVLRADVLPDRDTLMRIFYVDGQFVDLIQPVREEMKRRGLSIFRN